MRLSKLLVTLTALFAMASPVAAQNQNFAIGGSPLGRYYDWSGLPRPIQGVTILDKDGNSVSLSNGGSGTTGSVTVLEGGAVGNKSDAAYTGATNPTGQFALLRAIADGINVLSQQAQAGAGQAQHVVVDSSALPTGAATSAKQDSLLTALGSPMQQTGGTVGITGPVPLPTNASTEATLVTLSGKVDAVTANQAAMAAQLAGPDGPRRIPNPLPVLPYGFVDGSSVAEPPATPLTAPGIVAVTTQSLLGVGHVCWVPISAGSGWTMVVEELMGDGALRPDGNKLAGTWVQVPFIHRYAPQQLTLIARTASLSEVLCAPVSGLQMRLRVSGSGTGSVSYVGIGHVGPLVPLSPQQQQVYGDNQVGVVDANLRPVGAGGLYYSTDPTFTNNNTRGSLSLDTRSHLKSVICDANGTVCSNLKGTLSTGMSATVNALPTAAYEALWDGSAWNPRTGNIDTGTLLTASGATASISTANLINYNNRGAVCTLALTSISGGSASLAIQGVEPTSGAVTTIATMASQTTAGNYTLLTYPGISGGATTSVSTVVPHTYKVTLNVGSGATVSATVGCSFIQ